MMQSGEIEITTPAIMHQPPGELIRDGLLALQCQSPSFLMYEKISVHLCSCNVQPSLDGGLLLLRLLLFMQAYNSATLDFNSVFSVFNALFS